MKTVLISGCCGFIGQNLVSKLSRDCNIIGIDNFISSNRAILNKLQRINKFKFIEADIRDSININEKVDYIFNLACQLVHPNIKKIQFLL